MMVMTKRMMLVVMMYVMMEMMVWVMLVGVCGVLYTTHCLLEGMNLGVVLLVSLVATHSMVLATRGLYGCNLYLELVWLLAPTSVVVVLITRTVCMQCSDEEIASISMYHTNTMHPLSHPMSHATYPLCVSILRHAV